MIVYVFFGTSRQLAFGVSIERKDHFYETMFEVGNNLSGTNTTTLLIGVLALGSLFALKRFLPRVPAALVVVVGSILAVEFFDLEARGVSVVGDIPDSLPMFGLPDFSGSLIGDRVRTSTSDAIAAIRASLT